MIHETVRMRRQGTAGISNYILGVRKTGKDNDRNKRMHFIS